MKKRTSFYILLVLIFICVLTNYLLPPGNILSWDVFGYYLYLPLTFNYHDLGVNDMSHIDNILNTYHNSSTFYQGYQLASGKWIMKYSMGMAIMYAPFYFIGNLFAHILGYSVDGFSQPYQISIWIGSMFYTIAGLYILRKVLLNYFSEGVTAFTLVIIYLGTNYFIHSSLYGQNAMSHNYLFTLYAGIVYMTIKWHSHYKTKYAFLLAILCGLTTLSRPTEIVCFLIPVFWSITSRTTVIEKLRVLREKKSQVILFAMTVLIIGSWQVIYWKLFSGKWFVNSYGANAGEGLEFFHPFIVQVVASFRKGWFIYSPIMIFSLVGFVSLFRRNRPIFFALFAYFIANLYLVSCWSNWWYAESFGPRALIPSYAVLAIPLGFFLTSITKTSKVFKYTIGVVLVALVMLSLFQSWQFKEGIIHNSRMTRAYYFKVFGDTKFHPEYDELLLVNRNSGYEPVFDNEDKYEKTKTVLLDFENESKAIPFDSAYSGSKVIKLSAADIYSPVIQMPFNEVTSTDHAWIRASVMVYPTMDLDECPASLTISFHHKGWAYKFKAQDFEKLDLKLNQWNKVSKDYLTPEVRRKTDLLKVLVWFRGSTSIYVDNLQIEIFTKK